MYRKLKIELQEEHRYYFVGDFLDLSSLSIFAIDEFERSVSVDPLECTYSGFDSSECNSYQTVIVNWKGIQGSFIVSIVELKLNSLLLISEPNTTEYTRNQSLDLTGLSVCGIYSDGKKRYIPNHYFSISDCDFSEVQSHYPIVLSYQNESITFYVDIVLSTIVGIRILSIDSTFVLGSSFSLSNLQIAFVYDNNDILPISKIQESLLKISLFDTSRIGSYQANLTYQNHTARFDYEVVYPKAVSIKVVQEPKHLDYYVGEQLDFYDLLCEVLFENQTKMNIGISSLRIDGFDTSSEFIGRDVFVYFQDVGTSLVVNVMSVLLQSIQVIPPSKRCYVVGESFVSSGLVVYGILKDFSRFIIDSSYYQVLNFDSTCSNERLVCSVSYLNFKDDFILSVFEEPIVELLVLKQPSVNIFVENSIVDVSVFQDIGVYGTTGSDRIFLIPFSSLSFSDVSTSTLGVQNVFVTFEGFTDSFSITIVKKELIFISCTSLPYKLIYISTKELLLDGLEVRGSFNDGSIVVIPISDLLFYGYDLSINGYQYITIGYVYDSEVYETIIQIYVGSHEQDLDIYISDSTLIIPPESAIQDVDNLLLDIEIDEVSQTISFLRLLKAFPEYKYVRKASFIIFEAPGGIDHNVNFQDGGYQLSDIFIEPFQNIFYATNSEFGYGRFKDMISSHLKGIYQSGSETMILPIDFDRVFIENMPLFCVPESLDLLICVDEYEVKQHIETVEYGILDMVLQRIPDKIVYYIGEEIDITGLEVLVCPEVDISENYYLIDPKELLISGFDSSILDSHQKITVSKGSQSVTFEVSIVEQDILKVHIEKEPTKRIYGIGESIDLTGLQLIATPAFGEPFLIDNSFIYVRGFDSSIKNYYLTIYFVYREVSASFVVSIEAPLKIAVAYCLTSPVSFYRSIYEDIQLLWISRISFSLYYPRGQEWTQTCQASITNCVFDCDVLSDIGRHYAPVSAKSFGVFYIDSDHNKYSAGMIYSYIDRFVDPLEMIESGSIDEDGNDKDSNTSTRNVSFKKCSLYPTYPDSYYTVNSGFFGDAYLFFYDKSEKMIGKEKISKGSCKTQIVRFPKDTFTVRYTQNHSYSCFNLIEFIPTISNAYEVIGDDNQDSFGVYYKLDESSNEASIVAPPESSAGTYESLETYIIPSYVYKRDASSVKMYSVTTIDESAFISAVNLRSISSTFGLRYIKQKAFMDLKNLEIASISSNLESIESYVFSGCVTLSDFSFSSTIQSVLENCFDGCINLYSLDLTHLKKISSYLCNGCSTLSFVQFSEELTEIGDSAFCGTNLSSVRFLDSLQTIGEKAFYQCKLLNQVVITSSTIEVKSNAFMELCNPSQIIVFYDSVKQAVQNSGVSNFTKIICAEEFSELDEDNKDPFGVLYSLDDSDGSAILLKAPPELTTYKIPLGVLKEEQIYVVSKIGTGAFYEERKSYKITSVEIPDSVIEIQDMAFYNCLSLSSIRLSEAIVTLGVSVFSKSGLTEAVINCTVESIPTCFFQDCSNLRSVTISDSIKKIETNAFYGCSSLNNVSFNGDTIETGAFMNCSSLSNLNLKGDLLLIGSLAFSGCTSLSAVSIKAFSGSEEQKFILESLAFQKCSSLGVLSFLGGSVFSMGTFGSGVFTDCVHFGGILFYGCKSIDQVLDGALMGIHSTGDEIAVFVDSEEIMHLFDGKCDSNVKFYVH